MVKKFILLLLLGFACSTLISVIEVNRHGARTANNFSERELQSFYGINMKLTPNGFRQHQLLGHYMRDRYIDTNFISRDYKKSEFEIYSTPTQRTILSATGFLSGLYPGTVVKVNHRDKTLPLVSDDTIPVSDPLYNFKEIPLTVFNKEEYGIFDPWDCKLNGEVLSKKAKNKTVYPDLLKISEEDLKHARKEYENYFNVTEFPAEVSDEYFVSQVGKYVVPYFYHYGKDYYKELSKRTVDVTKKIYINKWYNARMKDGSLLKLSISRFFVMLLEKLKGAMNARTNNFLKKKQFVKYTVYSAHDTSIVNILSNLIDEEYLRSVIEKGTDNVDFYSFLVPPFASNMLFELHYNRRKGEYFVIIFYNGKVLNYPLRGFGSPADDGKIEFSVFEKLVLSRIDESYKQLDCSESTQFAEKVSPFPLFEGLQLKKPSDTEKPKEFQFLKRLKRNYLK